MGFNCKIPADIAAIFYFMTNDHDPTYNEPIVEEWPSPEEIDSLETSHGRKKDFDESLTDKPQDVSANWRILPTDAGIGEAIGSQQKEKH